MIYACVPGHVPSLATPDCWTIKEESFKTKEFNKTNEVLDRLKDLTAQTAMEMQTVMEVVRKVVEKVHHLYNNANADPIDAAKDESSRSMRSRPTTIWMIVNPLSV